MKSLILILLIALSADAQSLADAARQERQRQAEVQSVRIIKNEDILVSQNPAPVAGNPVSEVPVPAVAPPPANPPVPEVSTVDRAQVYREDVEKARVRFLELQDQEVALQLQLNLLTNQFFAPVTDQSTRDQAQARVGEIQNRLTILRGEMALSQRTLADMVAKGPPSNEPAPNLRNGDAGR